MEKDFQMHSVLINHIECEKYQLKKIKQGFDQFFKKSILKAK